MDVTLLRCPVDQGSLTSNETGYRCSVCGSYYVKDDGMPDLAYSPLPDVDGHVPYIWSDVFYLENVLRQAVKSGAIIVEVCSGPNIIVPLLLKRLNHNVQYYSVGINKAHLKQQQRGVDFPIYSIKGDATALPLTSKSIDIYIGHHAINDIWLTKGSVGVEKSYSEMHRVTKKDGYIIHSDCVLQHDTRVGDPSTKIVNLEGLKRFLHSHQYHWVAQNGGEMDWIIASQEQKCDFEGSTDFLLDGTLS
ncbi:MAG TPA: methyltransferase domain-containing protein [Ktedonobacteraceae bacterium]|nr:methyltransferase domain-containing protein [Ktedonobacteraceae bacterium]